MDYSGDPTGMALVAIAMVPILMFYGLPSIVAIWRRHRLRWLIVGIDVFLGWTGVGWLVALGLALWRPRD